MIVIVCIGVAAVALLLLCTLLLYLITFAARTRSTASSKANWSCVARHRAAIGVDVSTPARTYETLWDHARMAYSIHRYPQQTAWHGAHRVSILGPESNGYLLETDDHCILSFRGTQTLGDLVHNLKPGLVRPGRGTCAAGRVHGGFLDVYGTVRDQLRPLLARAAKPVYVTGHSLGAAVALVAAVDIRSTMGHDVHGFVFAPPKVGTAAYNEAIPATVVSVVNTGDYYSVMPPYPGYAARVGRTVRLFGTIADPVRAHNLCNCGGYPRTPPRNLAALLRRSTRG